MVLIIGSNLNDTINPFFNSSGPLLPTAFSDIINGGLGADTMDGGNGDDIYIVDNIGDVVRESFDTIAGGIDTVQSSVSYSLSPGTVVGTQGFAIENLTLTGTANINATGNAKSNKLLGNNGGNIFFGTAGNDTIDGGLGNDTANYSALTRVVTLGAFGVVTKGSLGTDTLVKVETIVGSNLLGDTVDHSGASVAPATGTITNLTTGAVTVSGTAFPLPLSFTVSQFEHVIGSGFADSITGNAANNSLNGGGGNDTIFGLAGNDTLNGEGGNDTLDGGTGNDLLNGGVGDDSLNGGDNNDTLIGSVGFDTINGGLGIDTATYSTLTNVVTLGAFGILSKGALGVDSLIGVESIVGSSLLGDTVDHSGASAAPATGTITNLTTGTVTVTGTAAPLPLTFSVSQFENVIGSGFADSITGNTANNSLSGGGGNDTISGLAGSDTLDGGAGNDSLDGGIGNDTLLGGSGNDTLIGGLGNDVLTGGLGNDRFRFLTLAERIDTITDFSRGFLIAPVDTLAATTTIIGPVFPLTNRDLVEVSASGFGATSLAQFSYNSTTGSLSFLGTQFATIQNLPSGFAVASDVVLI
jgi:serralysin